MRMPTTREANVCIQSTRPTARLLSVARTETSARPASEPNLGKITPLAHVRARAAHGTLQLSRKGLRDSYAGERSESQRQKGPRATKFNVRKRDSSAQRMPDMMFNLPCHFRHHIRYVDPTCEDATEYHLNG